jgi:hypothetical protein
MSTFVAEVTSMHSRRELFTAGLGSLVVLGSPSLLAARERQQGDSREFANGWKTAGLSAAVMHGTAAAFSQVIAAGPSVSDQHLAVADHAWHVMAAHLDELDFMTATDRLLDERGSQLVAGPPSDELLASVRQVLGENHVDIPASRLRSMLTTTPERVSAAVDWLRARGSREVCFSEIQFGPDFVAALREHSVSASGVHAQDWSTACGVLQIMVDILGIIAGLDALGCLVGIVPYCVAAAIFTVAAIALELLHDWVC